MAGFFESIINTISSGIDAKRVKDSYELGYAEGKLINAVDAAGKACEDYIKNPSEATIKAVREKQRDVKNARIEAIKEGIDLGPLNAATTARKKDVKGVLDNAKK